MPDPTNLLTDTTNHGEPMPDQTDLFPDSTAQGEPMPNPTHGPIDPATEGDLMTDDDDAMADTQRMLTPEGAALATLNGLASDLGHDEVRVLTRIAERLRGGRDVYGRLDLSTDTRTFRGKEAREELEDALVYLACAWLTAESHLEVNR